MITRRGFFGLLGGFAAAEVARKIYVLPPPNGWRVSQGEALFYLPSWKWDYRYAYRNRVTGCVSDATPRIAELKHTFFWPEEDVLDMYHEMTDGSFQLMKTVKGCWGIKG
jgi:hypothetical protein